eukprot:scaffold89159_cov21-Tisochrysis_lutea.AAC.1
MSSGADNALKHWVFDNMADAAPRLLRFRSGHAAPPTVVAHYGEVGAVVQTPTTQRRGIPQLYDAVWHRWHYAVIPQSYNAGWHYAVIPQSYNAGWHYAVIPQSYNAGWHCVLMLQSSVALERIVCSMLNTRMDSTQWTSAQWIPAKKSPPAKHPALTKCT